MPAGPCLEIGAGTGLLTPLSRPIWPLVLSLDLSPDMIARSRPRWRVRADASSLPIADGRVAVVVDVVHAALAANRPQCVWHSVAAWGSWAVLSQADTRHAD
jgi:SAM-dependent methyltransferase